MHPRIRLQFDHAGVFVKVTLFVKCRIEIFLKVVLVGCCELILGSMMCFFYLL